jgi:hypothetical protein
LEEESADRMSAGSAIVAEQSPGGKYDVDVSAVSSTEIEVTRNVFVRHLIVLACTVLWLAQSWLRKRKDSAAT